MLPIVEGLMASATARCADVPAMAATTQCVELGTFVVCTGFRNPALLANMAAIVDDISNGRRVAHILRGTLMRASLTHRRASHTMPGEHRGLRSQFS